ncbi:XdhC family protein [Enterobacteriaceae bacterium YMB-R22]|uniref:XdhC family protein n=1 Tax=Tenebrionicola larvae TaxID=2815733 RepID=UPI002012C13F|nr:XdhC/CoxI family protein [Tenebrionicola larvae]MBV4414068.1 XdhC family protein [Tenebrionicola larvae]
MNIFATLSRLEAENRSFALLQIIECRGSSPRHCACMLLSETGEVEGTIGGGMLERLAIARAREALEEGASCIFHGRLARHGENAVGSDCGGAVSVHIAVYPRQPELFLLGAGHVNREIARLALALNYRVTVADTWPDNLTHPQLPPACRRVGGDNYMQITPQLGLDTQSYVVIATNHEDREALEQVINQPYRYLGLLASRRKAHHLRNMLRKELGMDEETVARLYAPLGLDIGAETPAEIAVSVLAEIVREHRGTGKAARAAQPQTGTTPVLEVATTG